jgi:anti-sigma B factor antagonist
MPLRLTVDPGTDGRVATVAAVGDLDLSTAPDLERALAGVQADGRDAVLDLRAVSFMDSSGLRVILAGDARARASGARFVLVQGPPSVQRVFQLTLLDRRLEFVEDPAQVQA